MIKKQIIFAGFIVFAFVLALALNNSLTNKNNIAQQRSQVEVYFSPNDHIEEKLIEEINRCTKSLDIAIYTFTSEELRRTIESAAARGVSIRVLADKDNADDTLSVISKLNRPNSAIRLLSGEKQKNREGIMHNKFAIFDGKMVETGSYNWSYSANALNHENVLFVSNKQIVSSYKEEFNRLWESGVPL